MPINPPTDMRKAAITLAGSIFTCLLCLTNLSGCNYKPVVKPESPNETEISNPPTAESTDIPIPAEPSVLTVCLGQEPASLFLYGDSSQSARAVRQAIYDGPVDILGYEPAPVILEDLPTLAGGGVRFEPVTVQPGAELIDSRGQQVSLAEGVSFLPAGCADFSCALTYSGGEPVQMDQQVVEFRLRPGLTWADGAPLRADDSVYSFEMAQSLYPRARADIIVRTHSYRALDETAVEWRGIPGFHYAGYLAAFFTPLPRHAWGAAAAQDLLTAETATRKPLGWGAYQIDEWVGGDHITLSRNPNYFRKDEGLPRFDTLVFRFVNNAEEALAAIQSGECDLLDESVSIQDALPQFGQAQKEGKLTLLQQTGAAWEHLDFGIVSRNPTLPPVFLSREARQAVAWCIDRQKIVDELLMGRSSVMDSYIPADHPLFNPDVKRYSFDPNTANALLDAAGWRDDDGNPETPRRAQGVAGVPDGTALAVGLSTSDQAQAQRIAEIVRASLAQCGIQIDLQTLPADQLFGTGPTAPIFGQNFSLAQFGWMGAWQPPCFLYTTQEIPGPYPEFPKGWGGANASGFSDPDYDRACQRAQSALPEQPEFRAAHFLAQVIFAENLPALPLFAHAKQAVVRPGLCGVTLDAYTDSALWNIEEFGSGDNCP
ncbi:MAG: peptide ABC transporter substrate-binding protein [Anaerolineales bacterium]|nr:peptide ABC transporter substrate-binding protein [Anaerolineales bacterium]